MTTKTPGMPERTRKMSIENITIKQAREKIEECMELRKIFNMRETGNINIIEEHKHSKLGKRCLIRTYSAGVHIGDVVWVNPNNAHEVDLENSLRLWKWEGGGLSLSAVAKNGIKRGRLNETGAISLTNVIEMIPTTEKAEKTYVNFIED